MSSELLTLRGIIATIKERLQVLRAEEDQLKGTLLGLQLICPHTGATYLGTDPRGSSEGEERHRCGLCGKEWKG